MVRQDVVGGCSFQLYSRYLRSDCHRLFNPAGKNLRLAEIYAGLWMLGQSNDPICAEICNLPRPGMSMVSKRLQRLR